MDRVKIILDYNESVQSQLVSVCEPLSLLGISNFSYTKITKDRRYFRVGNYQPWTELIYKHDFMNHPLGAQGFACDETFSNPGQSHVILWNTDDSPLTRMRSSVNMWNGANIYRIYSDYFDVFSLGGTLHDTEIPNFIINNPDVLNRFFAYFKNTAREIIDTSDQAKTIGIDFHDRLRDKGIEKDSLHAFDRLIVGGKRTVTNGTCIFSISQRELDCLRYKNAGHSAKQMARLMNISYRTVDSYFANLRSKTDLNINQIIALCRKEGLL